MLRYTVIIAGAMMLTGCHTKSPVKDAVSKILSDPDSARFGDVTNFKTTDGEEGACVMVNAKNQMGGYTGDRLFYALNVRGTWQAMQSPTPFGDCSEFVKMMDFKPE